ncbi:MAG: Na/Pi cotransporter family protein [Spartobacteria bacterium]|nr:Na/Pi cotransporter family protein [Spartobacteria bacterium]
MCESALLYVKEICMDPNDLFFLIFAVLGGLALFIFGMNVMTDGLKKVAGSGLRTILARTTRNPLAGISLGTVLGFLVHSSATTVMLVGFVNAGLMTLIEAIPTMLGANIGTTLSMQVISFKLDKYCFFAIAIGFIINMASPNMKTKNIGRAIMGFGLLFLGMRTMSEAIKPHREALAPLLCRVDGSSLGGMLFGVLIATSITGVIQSSGATIGMCYALISAGVFTNFQQVYPIVLGAHIGTCATGLLGSIGTNIEARRTAISHLVFNIANVLMAIIAAPLFFKIIPMTSSDLIHQTANLHTAVITSAALLLLPFSRPYARFITLIVPSRKAPPQPSFLDNKLLARPEKAIAAGIQELQRVASICAQSLRLNAELLFKSDRKIIQTIKLNEKIVNEIKTSMRIYIKSLTSRYLSRRQAILLQHLDHCMSDIERIGDHIDEFCDLSISRNKMMPDTLVDSESFERLFNLYKKSLDVLFLVIDSLNPDKQDFQETARRIMEARDEYMKMSLDAKGEFFSKLANHEVTPIAGIYYSEYTSALDRIVRHSKTIALAERQPDFWIKRKKLDKVAESPPRQKHPNLVDPQDFLDKLQSESIL